MGNVKIGHHVWIGPYTIIEGFNDELYIGNYVSIDAGVMIYTHDSTKYYVSGGIVPVEHGRVYIDDYTVIGSMSIIRHGVTVGKHCVIGANSFVTKDVPDYSIVAGTPAKVIGTLTLVDDDVIFNYY